jgi:GT2 family glycosyltransferase
MLLAYSRVSMTLCPAPNGSTSDVRLSVIVPFHRNLVQLRQCLAGLAKARRASSGIVQSVEIIVAADGAVDDPAALAREFGTALLEIEGPRGPAVARSRAAAIASGNVLVFVDTDVIVSETSLAQLGRLFAAEPDLGAAFGAYDEEPADAGFVSQCRNLAHSFIHQRSNREASTFWAGLGAVRADVFAAVGGFDERFARPSVEDIDLGYRIRAAGFRVVLDPTIQGKHLKRWTFKSSVKSDVVDRGIPWTQLMQRYGGMRDDLNVTVAYRLCVVVAYALVISLLAAVRWPLALTTVPVLLALLWVLDRSYYQFFVRRRGLWFTLRWFPLHVLHHLCNGVSFAVGTMLCLLHRWFGVTTRGTLPLTPWCGVRAASPSTPSLAQF